MRNYFLITETSFHATMNTLYISVYPYLIHELQYVVVLLHLFNIKIVRLYNQMKIISMGDLKEKHIFF